MQEKVMIGIDGGGTKTEFVLFSEKGKILNRILLGSSNPNACGIRAACEIFMTGIDNLLQVDASVCGAFIGASGIVSEQDGERIESILQQKYPAIKIQCRTDIVNVIASATSGDKCIAAICGTGVIVYANEQGKLRRFGGYGYLFDPAGSGYHIGRDAICTALKEKDAIGKKSMLTALVEERLGGTAWDHIPDIYEKGQSYIASFASLVFEAYQSGDEVAGEILEANAQALAYLINQAALQCNCGQEVVLSGSIVSKSDVFAQMLRGKLNDGLTIVISEKPQVYGACIMCCKLCGADMEKMSENFMEYYDSY